MSFMPVMCGKRRGWACPALVLTTCETFSGMCWKAISLPPNTQIKASAMMTTPGSTVPMIKPLLVIPETVDVPLSVTHVANQYIMIEKSPTKTPFCARSGTPIMYAMDAAANPSTVGYHTTF